MFGFRRGKTVSAGGFLSRLARDTRGNVLAITAATILPLLCMIGSGIDLSRAYMAHARLQQACDAAALAGRRAMSDGTVDGTVRAEATKFFNFNFIQGAFGTAAFTPSIAGAANSTVVVAASTTIPTTVMKIFGWETLPLDVSCDAKLDFVNTDIVLVLDTTGSMDDAISGEKKIVSLRKAVLALYDELKPVQDTLTANGLRLRYGVVPYSSGVNVGRVVSAVSPGYIESESWDYQTRVGNYTTAVYAPDGAPTVTDETYASDLSASNCRKYGYNQSFTGFAPSPAGEPIATSTTLTYYLPKTFGGSTTFSGSRSAACVRTKTVYPRYTTRYKFASLGYQQDAIDTSRFAAGSDVTVAITHRDADNNTVIGGSMPSSGTFDAIDIAANASDTLTVPTGVDGNGVLKVSATDPLQTSTNVWSGCIEERDTTSAITGAYGYTVPAAAKDLNIDLIPYDRSSRWRPYWPEQIYRRDNGRQPQIACPTEAVRLRAWDSRDALSGYLNLLTPTGGTYHDNGMIWGARFISPNGVFGGDNPSTFGAMPVSRHIIFMTDGIIDTGSTLYSTYGMEYWDKRVVGAWNGDADSDARHDMRFKMMCNQTKGMGVSIWVVAFASTLSDSLAECASNSNQASTSADSTALIAKFVEIGKNIGALRLTK